MVIGDLLLPPQNRRWSFTSAISHQTWSIGWWRLCCDGERGSVPQLRRENSFLFVVCWSRNLQTQWPRRQRPRDARRAEPRKQKWRCCSRGEERSGRYWVSLSLQQDRSHLATSWCWLELARAMYPSDKAAGGLVTPWSPAGAAPVVELEVSPHTFTRLLLILSSATRWRLWVWFVLDTWWCHVVNASETLNVLLYLLVSCLMKPIRRYGDEQMWCKLQVRC